MANDDTPSMKRVKDRFSDPGKLGSGSWKSSPKSELARGASHEASPIGKAFIGEPVVAPRQRPAPKPQKQGVCKPGTLPFRFSRYFM